jgi:hypothetical protein
VLVAPTKQLGDIAEAAVMADVLRRGYRVLLPYGEDWPFDLVVVKNGEFHRVQVKHGRSSNGVLIAKCTSTNNWVTLKYTKDVIDVLAIWDSTTGRCFYIPAEELGAGRAMMNLRLDPARNNQVRGIRWAERYTEW